MWLLFLLLPAAAILAWFIRWRTLAARERWRNQNAARYAVWAREDDDDAVPGADAARESASAFFAGAGTPPEQLRLPP